MISIWNEINLFGSWIQKTRSCAVSGAIAFPCLIVASCNNGSGDGRRNVDSDGTMIAQIQNTELKENLDIDDMRKDDISFLNNDELINEIPKSYFTPYLKTSLSDKIHFMEGAIVYFSTSGEGIIHNKRYYLIDGNVINIYIDSNFENLLTKIKVKKISGTLYKLYFYDLNSKESFDLYQMSETN